MSQIENRLRNMEYRCQEAAGEIKRLREDNEVLRGESQRLRWERLRWDSKRRRALVLLRECQDYVEAGMSATDQNLCDRVERELGS